MKKQLLKYAKLSPAIVQAVGLFRSVKPGAREQRLEVEYEAKDKLLYRFDGPCLLGVDDMRVMQGIIAIACAQNVEFTSRFDAESGDQFEKITMLLSRKLDMHTTYDELARMIGYSASGSGADMTIRNALERLSTVRISIEPTGRTRRHTFNAGHIFERLSSDDTNKLVAVKICPLLAFAVLGGPGTYMRSDLVEARKLKTDSSRLLHMHLSWLTPGNSFKIKTDTLVSYVYGKEKVTADAQRKRRARAIEGLKKLASELGWIVTQNRSVFQVTRPSPRTQKAST